LICKDIAKKEEFHEEKGGNKVSGLSEKLSGELDTQALLKKDE
jgi:hypothetical protein